MVVREAPVYVFRGSPAINLAEDGFDVQYGVVPRDARIDVLMVPAWRGA